MTAADLAQASGLFITFEGGEGSGKSTQAGILAARLETSGREVVALREPGGTALGETLRDILLQGEGLAPEAELLLFLAARAQLMATLIAPTLARGAIVICDRFIDSTVAYQGYGRGLDQATIRALNAFATGGLEPDLTFFLDLPPSVGLARKGSEEDAFHQQSSDFHERVRAGYQAAGAGLARWHALDGSRPVDEIAAEIWQRTSERLTS